LLCCVPALADDTVLAEQVRYKEEVLQTLKNEIQQIDSEMLRCEKAKKGWVAATVIGGVGVAATGAAAIAQGVKISQNKKAATEPKEEKK
jgi:negative regulator of sigma E activity